MANIAIGGARLIKRRAGGNLEGTEEMPVASAYGTAIFYGDLVKRVNDGTIAAAAAGDAVYGIAAGAVRYKNGSGQIVAGNHLPASTTFTGSAHISNPQASIVKVIPLGSGDIFEMDVDTVVADVAAAQSLVGNNFDIVATAGSTTTGRSGYVVNNASGMGTATAQIRMNAVSTDPLNDVTAVNWKAQFIVNETTEPTLGVATGV
jgi:hypothetical protein